MSESAFGPFTWHAEPAGKRRWQLSAWLSMLLLAAAASTGMGVLGWLVTKAHDGYAREQAACAETVRVLQRAKPMLRNTVLTGDACRDVRRMQGEE